jgi:hypothetical protein
MGLRDITNTFKKGFYSLTEKTIDSEMNPIAVQGEYVWRCQVYLITGRLNNGDLSALCLDYNSKSRFTKKEARQLERWDRPIPCSFAHKIRKFRKNLTNYLDSSI